MKHYDNSRSGNDCWIMEHWYWHDEMDGFAVCVQAVQGWYEQGPEAYVYTDPGDDPYDMPDEVRAWFSQTERVDTEAGTTD